MWIHLGMEKIGMEAFALPFLSLPSVSFLGQCHPQPPKAASTLIPCQALVLNPLKTTLLLWQLEIKRVRAEDRLSAEEES